MRIETGEWTMAGRNPGCPKPFSILRARSFIREPRFPAAPMNP